MINKKSIIIIENQQNDILYQKNRSNLNITFNRIAFIFFMFLIICLIYSIHLVHLGSRNTKTKELNNIKLSSNKLYRADIVDNNFRYLVKTMDSIDIGISPSKIIDEKKLLLNLRFIFPN